MKIRITNPNKEIYSGIAKSDILDYYVKVSDLILPHLKNRPLSMLRYPQGIKNKGFFHKSRPKYFPDFIGKVNIKRRSSDEYKTYSYCNNKEALYYLINYAVTEFHIWMSEIDNIEKPNQIRLDLDPSKPNELEKVKEAAFKIKEILDMLKLKSFVMLSGGKGLHITIPINPEFDFDTVNSFTKNICRILEYDEPDKYTTEFLKEKRKGRIFLDYHRNEFSQTAICPYSLRARENAPIALPVKWEDIENLKSFNQFTLKNMDILKDPWKNYFTVEQSIEKPKSVLENLFNT